MHVLDHRSQPARNYSTIALAWDATNVIKNWDDIYFEKLLVRFTYSMSKWTSR